MMFSSSCLLCMDTLSLITPSKSLFVEAATCTTLPLVEVTVFIISIIAIFFDDYFTITLAFMGVTLRMFQ